MTFVYHTDAGGDKMRSLDLEGRKYSVVKENVDEMVAQVREVRDIKGREDDILICCYPRSGTHWMFEVVSMLVNGNAESVREMKQNGMLEVNPAHVIDARTSPRVLDSHFFFDCLPTDMIQKKCKIILVHRNPKDVCVSLYKAVYGLRQFFEYDGKLENWIPAFLSGEFCCDSWFDYILSWEKVRATQEIPIHQMFYEDMKEDPVREIIKLAKFLNIKAPDELYKRIAENCAFDKMVVNKKGLEPEDWLKIWRDRKPAFYRKGEVGDWKNWLTVKQSEDFDEVYRQKMKDCKLTFRYEI